MAEQLKPRIAGGDVPQEKLLNYAGRVASLHEDIQGIRGDLSSVLKEAEDVGIHKAAFKLAIKLRQQTEEKRADFLRAFDDYRAKFGLDGTPDMFDEPPAQRRSRRLEPVN